MSSVSMRENGRGIGRTVLRLDVAVKNDRLPRPLRIRLRMAVVQCERDLRQVRPHDVLRQHATRLAAPLDHARKVASRAVLHEDVEHVVGLVDEALVVADDVVVRAELFKDVAAPREA